MIFLSKSQIVFCFAAVLFAVCAGCIDVTYSGQRFPVYGIGGNAAVFRLGEKVPEDTYRTIGHIRLKANSGTPVLDFYEKLENEVFELGADAAAVDFFEPVLVSNPRLAQISAADYEPGGFGGDLKAPAGGGDGVVDRYVVVLEARVLVFEERFIEEMALRREGKTHPAGGRCGDHRLHPHGLRRGTAKGGRRRSDRRHPCPGGEREIFVPQPLAKKRTAGYNELIKG